MLGKCLTFDINSMSLTVISAYVFNHQAISRPLWNQLVCVAPATGHTSARARFVYGT